MRNTHLELSEVQKVVAYIESKVTFANPFDESKECKWLYELMDDDWRENSDERSSNILI